MSVVRDTGNRGDDVDLVPELGKLAPARPSTRRRRVLLAVIAVLLVLALALLGWAQGSGRDSNPLSAQNPRPGGAQATAEILRDRGVDVQVVDSLGAVLDLAGPDVTVAVTDARQLSPEAAAQLAGTGADQVWVGPTSPVLRAVDAPLATAGGGSTAVVQPGCADPDARAATRIGEFRGGLEADGTGAELCFTADGDASAYAVWDQGSWTMRVLADGSLMSNERLDEDGHAALALRALGHHDTLVWFTPLGAVEAVDLEVTPPPASLSPRWFTMIGWAAAFAIGVLALARGRHLGAVIPEPLPVVVRSAETVRGRGALYRRGGATAHASAGLRAGSASRLARRLGLPRATHRTDLVSAVAAASGRDEAWVRDLLYGAPPSGAEGLSQLADDLDTLESEVHRP